MKLNKVSQVAVAIVSAILLIGCQDEPDPDANGAGGGGDEPKKPAVPALTLDKIKQMAETDVEGFERSSQPVERPHARWSYTKKDPTAGGGIITARLLVSTKEEDSTIAFSLDPENVMNASYVKLGGWLFV